MNEKLHIVSIAHTGLDLIKSTAGTVAKYTREGHQAADINVIKFTEKSILEPDGMLEAKKFPDINTPEEVNEIFYKQASEASSIIGANYRSLDFTHEQLSTMENNWDAIRLITNILRELKADIVFTHFPEDTSYGSFYHAAVGKVVTAACYYSARREMVTEYPPHRIRCLLYFLSNSWTPAWQKFDADLFIDITDTIKIKHRALQKFTHAGVPTPSILREYRFVQNRMNGVISGCQFAEAFKLPYSRWMKLAFKRIPEEWLEIGGLDLDHTLSPPETFE